MKLTFMSLLLLLVTNLALSLAAKVCPKTVNKGDAYKVEERFQKIVADIGSKRLRTSFLHQRTNSKDMYDYELNFCGQNDQGAAVIQRNKETKKIEAVLGKFHHAVLVGAEDWIFVQYFNGTKFHPKEAGNPHHCDGKARQSWISIRCEDQGEAPQLRVIEEARYQSGTKHPETPCYYLFEFNHKYACSDEILSKLKKHKLSGGAIFCIILFTFALAYLVFGFLYQRFVVGAKGFEQIPNFSFWKKVGNASADGCDFVCRREEHPSTYKGMSDALDIESSDDEKDDGLLPM